jgi:hypothetical protein
MGKQVSGIDVSNEAAAGGALSDDIVWGVDGIATEIGRTPRQTFHLISTGAIPAGKAGGRIFASRARLREHFRALLDSARA